MKRLFSDIQRDENTLNVIMFDDKPQKKSNGIHHYKVVSKKRNTTLCDVQFQEGPRKVKGSKDGVLDADLLEIVRHRLERFQTGEFACEENALALQKVNEALLWLTKRTNQRASRGILGTNKK